MWTILAAMVLLFLGMFIVLFTCFNARKEKRRTYKNNADTLNGNGYNGVRAQGVRRKRFGLF